jgi:hypothetical protein
MFRSQATVVKEDLPLSTRVVDKPVHGSAGSSLVAVTYRVKARLAKKAPIEDNA